MVYIREDTSEDVTGVSEESRHGMDGVRVETNKGHFEYWFPLVDAPDYHDGPDEHVLDPTQMRIRENGDPPATYTGTSSLTVPEVVTERAEQFTNVPVLE